MPMPFGLPTLGAFALPVVALALGGVIATIRPPGSRLRSALLHFVLVAAAGASVFRGLGGLPLAITLAFGFMLLLGMLH
jgi:hypothetical protein